MTRFQGWTISLWLSCSLIIMTALIIVFGGWNEAGLRTLVRSSAQTSATFFLLAFSASSLRSVWPTPFTHWLVRNRRYIGVSFGVSHFLHLAALLAIGIAFPDPFICTR